jgi:ketosteroid isomerase-like protein
MHDMCEESPMNPRVEAERIVNRLQGARTAGDLNAICHLFADDGHFKIAGASADKPIAIVADSFAEFRPWLLMMVKVFRLTDYRLISLVVEWPKAVAHWQTHIYSKVTGTTVPTELVDILEIRDGKIVRYDEFFVPCAPFDLPVRD